MAGAMTEKKKRESTMSVLDGLRNKGAPKSRKYKDQWSGEELPLGEEPAQDDYQQQLEARQSQGILNRMDPGFAVRKPLSSALGGANVGPTGMSPEGTPTDEAIMIPYSKEEYDRRSSFTPTKPRKPVKKK